MSSRRSHSRIWCACFLMAGLATFLAGVGCQSGGTLPNIGPVVAATPDQTVAPGQSVTLKVTAIDPNGSKLTYAWTQTEGGSVEIGNATGDSITFTAPTISEQTALKFKVVVSDGSMTSTEEITVTVSTTAAITPTPTPNPTGTPTAQGTTWYLRAIGASIDDLSGTLGEDLKKQVRSSTPALKVVASTQAQDALTDVLDKAKQGRFDDAFFSISVDKFAVGTGLYFEAFDDQYNTTAVGFPSIEVANTGLFANMLHVPIHVRREGPIIAMRKDTLNGLSEDAGKLMQSLVDRLITASGVEANRQAVQGLIAELNTIPTAPNAAGTLLIDKDINFSFSASQYNWKTRANDVYQYNFAVEVDGNADRNETQDRWVGAVKTFGKMSPASDPNMVDSIGVTAGVGLQKLDNPRVIFVEPGNGTSVDTARLAGTWAATFPGSLVGDLVPANSAAMIKLVFDSNGQWTDVLFGASANATAPASEFEFFSLKQILSDPDRYLHLGLGGTVTLPYPEFRTTLDAAGNVRLDMIFSSPAVMQTVMVNLVTSAAGLGRGSLIPGVLKGIDPADQPGAKIAKVLDNPDYYQLPVMSFIGRINNNKLEGEVLFFLLCQPANFDKQQ